MAMICRGRAVFQRAVSVGRVESGRLEEDGFAWRGKRMCGSNADRLGVGAAKGSS
jgi:hypothetical protein